ncbi:unnamed protein product, partial [Sphacelaria rigidula]
MDDQVVNVGNVDLTEVTVQDPPVPNDCVVAELGVAVTMSCNGTYSLTWADIRAGTRSNRATVSSTGPGNTGTFSNSSTDDTVLKPPPSISVAIEGLFMDESVPEDNLATAGETIQYNLTVTNDGHATLYDVTVSDPLV